MESALFKEAQDYMEQCMQDCAHDRQHVYRVLKYALDIADHEPQADRDIVFLSALLHDIGREEQLKNPQLCHAQIGSQMAYDFLLKHGLSLQKCEQVRHCILSHRFRSSSVPQTLEAKILFDADKLDVCGAIGIARTLLYSGAINRPLYHVDAQGRIQNSEQAPPSFLSEYHLKLKKLYDSFYTEHGAQLALKRRNAAIAFYESLLDEIGVKPL